ncbi:hypothetical protein H4Q26_007041 [Puccinia striiformis f. sp. tritici PST-130]|nr:hypothetical protein H4Q26_007041 [Puccinia striiformis f. sp. tritici PST-130]
MASFSFSVEKLLSPNHDHSQPNELWPHQIWDLEYTNNWNNNVKDRLTIEELLFFQSSTINQFNPTPKSIFDHHQSAGSSSSSWEWDSWACVNCDHAIFISSPTQAIGSVFDKQAAIDLINHAKLYNNSAAPEQAVYRAWHTVFIVIQNALLEGKLSPLPLNGKSISGRMPWDPISADDDTSNNNGWRTKNGLPVGWETYSKLGIVSEVTDTMVILGYQTQVKVYPHFSYLFFDAIREIHSIRESQTLADFLDLLKLKKLDYICNDDENDQIELELDLSKEDHLINSFNSKQIRSGMI